MFSFRSLDVWEDRVANAPVHILIHFYLHTQTATALWSCPSALQVNGCADYPQALDTRQILVLSSVPVGRPSKPCYRIGARQLAQLAFGKPPEASHGASFALMVPDKPADLSWLQVAWLHGYRVCKQTKTCM